MSSTRRGWIGACGALLLGGCGFTRSRPSSYAFRTLHIAGSSLSPLAAEMQRQLQLGGAVEVITDPRQIERADLVLEFLQDFRERVILGRTSTGAVREFQLRMRVRLRARNREGIERIPEVELEQRRDITFNESFVLSKSAEEALLYANMQTEMVQQILRRLAALQEI
jgi:LPS-assembly lipoprotein